MPYVLGMTPTYYLLKYFEVVPDALPRTIVTLPCILNSGPDIIGILYEISYYDDVSFWKYGTEHFIMGVISTFNCLADNCC